MNPMKEAVQTVLSKYADFTGRAPRREFWWWVLFVILLSIVTGLIDQVIFGSSNVKPLTSLLGLALIIPEIAVGARRLHDIGRSGWWLLISLIPIIGQFILLFWFVQPSEARANAYGPEPA